MNIPGLSEHEAGLIAEVLKKHPEVSSVILYGSRANGSAVSSSDIDIALEGVAPLKAAAIASELDDLPLPYKFDVRAMATIQSDGLLQEIRTLGVKL